MPKFYLDVEEKGKGYIVGWKGLKKTKDGQNNHKGQKGGAQSNLQIPTGITLTEV